MVQSILILCSVFLLQTSDDSARSGPKGQTTQPQAASTEFSEGLWPSRKLMNLVLIRWTEALGDQFELTDQQRAEVRKRVPKRWADFLDKNRAPIQPLVNEYLELHMGLEPPTPDRVRDWAGRALPVFGQLRAEFDEGINGFRDVLEPSQKAKFEAKALELGVGMQLAKRKLQEWSEGQFVRKEFWTPPRKVKPDRGEKSATSEVGQPELNAGSDIAAGRTTEGKIEQELQAWDQYVSDYIRDHKFNLGQQTASRSCLNEMKGRARDHRDRFREEILELEKQIEGNTGTERELTEIKEKLVRLYGPVDAMFAELKHRIEQIATSAQRDSETPKPVQKAD